MLYGILWMALALAVFAAGIYAAMEGFFSALAVAVVVTCVLFVVGGRQMAHDMGKQACAAWGRNIGREARYIDNTYWDFGCYVRTDSGNWIPREDLAEIEVRK
jgi:hypothetical protein